MDLRFPICDLQLASVRRASQASTRVTPHCNEQVAAKVPLRLLQSQIANRKSKISGYSFTEVMFAVIVLGIGFIMVAAVFPVAIQQSAATAEEGVGASIARGAVSYLQSIATNATMPFTAGAAGEPPAVTPLLPGVGGGWEAVRGNLILPDDSRFAWVPLYRRHTGENVAQVFVIPVQVRSRSQYGDNNDAGNKIDITPDLAGGELPNLYPRLVTVNALTNDEPAAGVNIDVIVFDEDAAHHYESVGEGSYVVIADATGNVDARGRIYRVGVRREDLDATVGGGDFVWELQAGNDIAITGTAHDLTGADNTAYVVGREIVDPTATTAREFRGPVQDIGIYTTFTQVR